MATTNPVMKMNLGTVSFWCDPCNAPHGVLVGFGGWTFNNSLTAPTLSPSINIIPQDSTKPKCHFVIEKGTIHYLDDCEHTYAGDLLLLRPIVDWPAVW